MTPDLGCSDQRQAAPDNWENRLAFALLERYGTPPARQILEAMAMGPEDLWRTKEARAVLERLAKKK